MKRGRRLSSAKIAMFILRIKFSRVLVLSLGKYKPKSHFGIKNTKNIQYNGSSIQMI